MILPRSLSIYLISDWQSGLVGFQNLSQVRDYSISTASFDIPTNRPSTQEREMSVLPRTMCGDKK